MNQTLDMGTNHHTSNTPFIKHCSYQDFNKYWKNLITELPKRELFLEEGKYLKVSLGDYLKGYHLVAFYHVKVFYNSVLEQIWYTFYSRSKTDKF